jgi:hypothetical protein
MLKSLASSKKLHKYNLTKLRFVHCETAAKPIDLEESYAERAFLPK